MSNAGFAGMYCTLVSTIHLMNVVSSHNLRAWPSAKICHTQNVMQGCITFRGPEGPGGPRRLSDVTASAQGVGELHRC